MVKQQYKFEKLEVWNLSLEYSDIVYKIAEKLPDIEKFNLYSQFTRSATSICLNIAEGSTSTSNAEQKRYLSISIHSYIESFACYRLIQRRKYIGANDKLCEQFEITGVKLFAKLQAFLRSI